MRKIRMFCVLMLSLFMLAGCSHKAQPTVSSEEGTSTEAEASTEESEKQKEPVKDAEQSEEQKEPEENAPQATTITIYYGNENADGLLTEESSVTEVSPEILLQKLMDKGVVPSDIAVLKCEQVDAEGVSAIDLDLSETFLIHLSKQGTAGEIMTIESMVNTFLKAYDCEKICITVNGGLLETGHAEYPGYMAFFENN